MRRYAQQRPLLGLPIRLEGWRQSVGVEPHKVVDSAVSLVLRIGITSTNAIRDMPQLRVRNLDEWVCQALKDRARRNGHSLEAELRDLLRAEALRPKQELAAELHRLHDEQLSKYGVLTDSTPDIRADRDAAE